MKVTLPACIRARRIGHWSYGSDTEYDENGAQAPVTWTCNCRSWITLEVYNCQTGEYTDTPKELLKEFLAKHTDCVAMCYKCGVLLGERLGDWCNDCEATEPY